LCGVLRGRVFAGPKTVSMHITNICNLSCLYCWYHSPLIKDRKLTECKKREMPFEVFKNLIDDCYGLKVERIQLSAQGEPSLHSRFIDMVKYLHRKRFSISLVSNGTFKKAQLRHLLEVDDICVDLSSADPQSYRELQSHKTQDLFSVVMRNLAFFSALKNKNKKTPRIKVNYILNSENYMHLPDIFKLFSEINIDNLNILNVDACDHNSKIALTKTMAHDIEVMLQKLLREKFFLRVASNLHRNHRYSGKFLNKLNLDPMPPPACYHGWYYAFVSLAGNVTPCCKLKRELIAGNLYQASFRDIWNSDEFNKIRISGMTNLYHKRFASCQMCCFYKLNEEVYEKLKRTAISL
jgi:radical SAM protein with 4Fe4S-binding SPASM domain